MQLGIFKTRRSIMQNKPSCRNIKPCLKAPTSVMKSDIVSQILHNTQDVPTERGRVLFALGYTQIVPTERLKKHTHLSLPLFRRNISWVTHKQSKVSRSVGTICKKRRSNHLPLQQVFKNFPLSDELCFAVLRHYFCGLEARIEVGRHFETVCTCIIKSKEIILSYFR